MFEFRGICKWLVGYGERGQKAGKPERDLKSTKLRKRPFKGKGSRLDGGY